MHSMWIQSLRCIFGYLLHLCLREKSMPKLSSTIWWRTSSTNLSGSRTSRSSASFIAKSVSRSRILYFLNCFNSFSELLSYPKSLFELVIAVRSSSSKPMAVIRWRKNWRGFFPFQSYNLGAPDAEPSNAIFVEWILVTFSMIISASMFLKYLTVCYYIIIIY